MKKCPKCGQTKPLSEFHKNRASRDGLSRLCKVCNSAVANAWKKNNPDRVKQVRENYLAVHLEEERGRTRTWVQKNLDRVKALNQLWYKNHPDWVKEKHCKRRAAKKKNGGKFTAEDWRKLKEFYGYACLRCGKKEPEIKLTPDHVIPLKNGGRNSIENIQPLCLSCNCSKRAKRLDYRPVIFYG